MRQVGEIKHVVWFKLFTKGVLILICDVEREYEKL